MKKSMIVGALMVAAVAMFAVVPSVSAPRYPRYTLVDSHYVDDLRIYAEGGYIKADMDFRSYTTYYAPHLDSGYVDKIRIYISGTTAKYWKFHLSIAPDWSWMIRDEAALRCRIQVSFVFDCIEIFPESDGTFVAQITLMPDYMEMPIEVPNGDYGFTVGAWFGYSFATLYSFELYWE